MQMQVQVAGGPLSSRGQRIERKVHAGLGASQAPLRSCTPPPGVSPWRYMPRPKGRYPRGPHLSRPGLAHRLFSPTSAARPCLRHLYPLDPAPPSWLTSVMSRGRLSLRGK